MSKIHHFYSAADFKNVPVAVQEAIDLKKIAKPKIGLGKTMVLLFFNSSLRTRLSTEIAAQNLGMNVITMDMSQSWKWELEEGTTMRFDTAEHIKDAAQVISGFANIVGIRAFPTLTDKEADYQDNLLQKFMQYADVPVVNMESAIRHPLQSLTDMMTIREFQKTEKPKVVLSWAPHPKALPQAVSNSFLEWAAAAKHEVIITHPKGYELANEFTKGHTVEYDQKKAFAEADFIYTKNWSPLSPYGKVMNKSEDWRIDEKLMSLTNEAKFNKLTIVKIGGNILNKDADLDDFLNKFKQIKGKKILVHGGGRSANILLQQVGISPKMHKGRRITDNQTLRIVNMVYAGEINKKVVSLLQTKGMNALGLSGADANVILAKKRPVVDFDYGFAGDIISVQNENIRALLEAGFTPVFCSITHDGKGQLLNTNADTIAATLAAALAKDYSVSLRFCFELNGVLEDIERPKSVISKISEQDFIRMQEQNSIVDGMIPKLYNALNAKKAGTKKIFICSKENLLNPETATEII